MIDVGDQLIKFGNLLWLVYFTFDICLSIQNAFCLAGWLLIRPIEQPLCLVRYSKKWSWPRLKTSHCLVLGKGRWWEKAALKDYYKIQSLSVIFMFALQHSTDMSRGMQLSRDWVNHASSLWDISYVTVWLLKQAQVLNSEQLSRLPWIFSGTALIGNEQPSHIKGKMLTEVYTVWLSPFCDAELRVPCNQQSPRLQRLQLHSSTRELLKAI